MELTKEEQAKFEDNANELAYVYHQMHGRSHGLSEFVQALKRYPDLTVRDAFAEMTDDDDDDDDDYEEEDQ